jgi:chaperonin GroES
MEPQDGNDGVLTEAEATETPDNPFEGMPPAEFVQAVTQAQNLAADLPEEELNKIAQQCLDDYDADKASMADWRERMERGLDLARLVKTQKDYPFSDASNVKYPLIASAALQFNARAYPAIVPAGEMVKAQTFGADRNGQKAARAERVAGHMSWQLGSQIEEWEAETDRLLLQLPIVGTMIRKWWIDPVSRRARCRLIESGKFIVNDKVKNLNDAPRCSEELPLFPAEIETRVRTGQFIECDYDEGTDKQAPQDFIEQHTRIDLDDDGYPEPYIVTLHRDKRKIVRMVADFAPGDVTFHQEPQTVMGMAQGMDPMTRQPVMIQVPQQVMVPTSIVQINRGSYFVDFNFWPSLDGGFHGTGLGMLLGDISDAINTIFNMLLDAGHYASLGGGFIGSEFRMKGGAQRFKPGEWKLANSTGGDIRSGIVPMTFPGPDQTLFALLGMLIDAGREISSTKDIMTGDSGDRAQTATTTLALIEQGMMVFTAAYKRIFASLKREYRMLAKINAQVVTPEEYNRFHDVTGPQGQPVMFDPRKEYDLTDMDIAPVADPRSVTKMQQAAKAQLLLQLAENGMVNPQEAIMRALSAVDIGDTEALMPQQDPAAAAIKQMGMAAAQADLVQKRADLELTLAKIEGLQASALKDVAAADATAAGTRLEALRMMIEHERDALDRAIGVAGMVGESRNAGAPQGNGAASGGAGRAMPPGLLVGQPGPGGAPLGAATGGTMGGGLL